MRSVQNISNHSRTKNWENGFGIIWRLIRADLTAHVEQVISPEFIHIKGNVTDLACVMCDCCIYNTWANSPEPKYFERSPCGGVVYVLDCNIVASKSCYYVHFQTNTFRKSMNPPYPHSYGLNNTTSILSTRIALALNNLLRLIYH